MGKRPSRVIGIQIQWISSLMTAMSGSINDLGTLLAIKPSKTEAMREKRKNQAGLLVCKVSNPVMKGTVLKKQGMRACVDFNEGDNMRVGLASISNLLGGKAGTTGGGLKAALSRAMTRASTVHKKQQLTGLMTML